MRLAYQDRHPTKINLTTHRAITLCEAVARIEQVSYRQQLTYARDDQTLLGTVARWALGQDCTPDQWRELSALCCSQGSVVRSYSIPWTSGRIQ